MAGRRRAKRCSPADRTLWLTLGVTLGLQCLSAALFCSSVKVGGRSVTIEGDMALFGVAAVQLVQVVVGAWCACAAAAAGSRPAGDGRAGARPAAEGDSAAERRATLTGAVALFLATALAYLGVYSLVVLLDGGAFAHLADDANGGGPAGRDAPEAARGVSVLFVLLFFSVETQSLVGLGDAVPTSPLAQGVALTQQVAGVLFSVFIIAQVLPAFGRDARTAAEEEREQEEARERRRRRRAARQRRRQEQQDGAAAGADAATAASSGPPLGISAPAAPHASPSPSLRPGRAPVPSPAASAASAAADDDLSSSLSRLLLSPPALPLWPGAGDDDLESVGAASAGSVGAETDDGDDDGAAGSIRGLDSAASSVLDSPPLRPRRGRLPSATPSEEAEGGAGAWCCCFPRRGRCADAAEGLRDAVVHDETVTLCRHWARNRLVLVSAGIQLVVVGALAADPDLEGVLRRRQSLSHAGVLWAAVVLELVQVAVIVSTSLKFVARAWSVTVPVLLQAYVSLVLAFAGVYLLLFLLGSGEEAFSVPQRAWQDPSGGEEPSSSGSQLLALVFEFVYFAFAVQSSTGFGDVAPAAWYTRLACMTHIVTSLLFNGIVLGYGLAHVGEASRRREAVKRALVRGRRVPRTAGRRLSTGGVAHMADIKRSDSVLRRL